MQRSKPYQAYVSDEEASDGFITVSFLTDSDPEFCMPSAPPTSRAGSVTPPASREVPKPEESEGGISLVGFEAYFENSKPSVSLPSPAAPFGLGYSNHLVRLENSKLTKEKVFEEKPSEQTKPLSLPSRPALTGPKKGERFSYSSFHKDTIEMPEVMITEAVRKMSMDGVNMPDNALNKRLVPFHRAAATNPKPGNLKKSKVVKKKRTAFSTETDASKHRMSVTKSSTAARKPGHVKNTKNTQNEEGAEEATVVNEAGFEGGDEWEVLDHVESMDESMFLNKCM
ncbi:hypothetical protein SVAN01_04911 [Stagonosporopsis vannaccii]|nr:hypothetical protein SVAN01_04911 [Stagonosporopsis vannaccii]